MISTMVQLQESQLQVSREENCAHHLTSAVRPKKGAPLSFNSTWLKETSLCSNMISGGNNSMRSKKIGHFKIKLQIP